MNRHFALDGEKIRDWLNRGSRKQTFLVRELGVSQGVVARMLAGRAPKERTVKALADLMGVAIHDLLIPQEGTEKRPA